MKFGKVLCISVSALMLLSVANASTDPVNTNAKHRTRISRVKRRQTKRLHKINKPFAYVNKATSWPVDITNDNGYKDIRTHTIVKILKSKPWNYEGTAYTKVKAGKTMGYIPTKALSQYPNKKVNITDSEVLGYSSLSVQLGVNQGKKQDVTYNKIDKKYSNTSSYKLGFREGRRDTAMMRNRRDRANGDEFDPYLAMRGENLLIKDLTSNHHCYNKAYKAGFVQGYIHGDPDLFTVPYTPKRDLAWGGVREDSYDAKSQYYGDRDDANDLINFAKKYMHTKSNKAKQKLISNDSTLLYSSLHDAKVQLFTDVDEEDVNPHTTHGKALNHEVKEIMSDKDFY